MLRAVSSESIKTSRNAALPYAPELVRRRYDRLAPWYRIFEWVLWLPRGIRDRAIRKLELQRGDAVLELGCETLFVWVEKESEIAIRGSQSAQSRFLLL